MKPKLISRTIWITGVTASGKTTLGNALYTKLLDKQYKKNIVFLDGDELRKKLKKSYGHNIQDRFASLLDLVEVAKKYYDRKMIVIVSTVSFKREMREYARSMMPHFMEVYLDCSIDVCSQRDIKGHYRRAFNGEYETFIGVTDEYELSLRPELILNTETKSIDECSEILYKKTKKFLKL